MLDIVNVTDVRALINILHNETNKCSNVKFLFFTHILS
jgi:hypothetical protein